MDPAIEALKKKFRDGLKAEAIAECEALCLQQPQQPALRRLCAMMHALTGGHARALVLQLELLAHAPDDADLLFNIALCERELQDFAAAAARFEDYVQRFPSHPDGWASLAECRLRLGQAQAALAAADRALQLDPVSVPGWTVRADGQRALGQAEPAVASYDRAITLAPQLPALKVRRAELLEELGRPAEAASDYRAALALAPRDDETLKKATLCLLRQDRGPDAIALCREVLKVHPDSLAARLGIDWLLSQLVPFWHVPMMNDEARNRAYHDGLQAAQLQDKLVFEIGTGAGLVAMMAARLGARSVVSCEAVPLLADMARQIVQRNGLHERITVLARPSFAVQPGRDLPQAADVLVHEIFSSELLGEHVLPAIEDAKARLLKPGGTILPAAASLMIALLGGEELALELHVGQVWGFDLQPFNAIHPKKRPLHREDLPRVLLSDDTEAFRFDFAAQSHFPPEKKRLELVATRAGTCYGVVQWVRLDFGAGVRFENHPSVPRPVANWQHTVYRFDTPLALAAGARVAVAAAHDRSRPWFERVA